MIMTTLNGAWSDINLNPADHHLARIRKGDKDFARELDFKDIKIPVKIRNIHKIEKNSIEISVFVYENKEKYPLKDMLIYY